MIVRGVRIRVLRHCVTRSQTNIRKFTIPAATPATSTAASAHPLATVTTQLDRVSPRFEIDASAINILSSPAAFYETLKVVKLMTLKDLF